MIVENQESSTFVTFTPERAVNRTISGSARDEKDINRSATPPAGRSVRKMGAIPLEIAK
jgi:hypothetical protein